MRLGMNINFPAEQSIISRSEFNKITFPRAMMYTPGRLIKDIYSSWLYSTSNVSNFPADISETYMRSANLDSIEKYGYVETRKGSNPLVNTASIMFDQLKRRAHETRD